MNRQKRDPKIPSASPSPRFLSLCMIVRDEEDFLGDCLKTAQGLVDELIVVDTGSTDRTVEIAEGFGARVFHFQWIDDFSAARNESIRHATGDNILWLDADDRLSREARRALARLKRRLSPEKNLAYRLPILNRKQNGETALNYQLRIFPNIPGARFEGRVHEEIEPSLLRLGIKIERAEVHVLHTGYLDDEAIREKAARNLDILLRGTGERERTAGEYFHLAQSYLGIKDYHRCIECLDRASSGREGARFQKWGTPIAVVCHLELDQAKEAIEKVRRALRDFPESGYLHYMLGLSLFHAEKYEDAIPCLDRAASLGIEVESFPIPADIRTLLAHFQGRALEETGRPDLAEAAYRRALRESPDHVDTLRALGFLISGQGRFEEALALLEKARKWSPRVEKGIWLALARLDMFFQKNEASLQIYSEILEEDPEDRDALAGMAKAAIALGRADRIIFSFEGLLKALKMNTHTAITSFADLARLAREIYRGLKLAGDHGNADIFEEISSQMEPLMNSQEVSDETAK